MSLRELKPRVLAPAASVAPMRAALPAVEERGAGLNRRRRSSEHVDAQARSEHRIVFSRLSPRSCRGEQRNDNMHEFDSIALAGSPEGERVIDDRHRREKTDREMRPW